MARNFALVMCFQWPVSVMFFSFGEKRL